MLTVTLITAREKSSANTQFFSKSGNFLPATAVSTPLVRRARSHRIIYSLKKTNYSPEAIIAAALPAIIMVGELVLPEVMRGITEASAMRRPSIPMTFRR